MPGRATPYYEGHGGTVSPDAFADGLAGILAEVGRASEEALDRGVQGGIRQVAREWRSNAASTFGGSGAYAGSIHSRVDSRGGSPEAHAYSDMPGLPHLLEKGHATIGGNFVAGRSHIAPAAESGFKRTVDIIREELGRL
jgi:hypothetical protein